MGLIGIVYRSFYNAELNRVLNIIRKFCTNRRLKEVNLFIRARWSQLETISGSGNTTCTVISHVTRSSVETGASLYRLLLIKQHVGRHVRDGIELVTNTICSSICSRFNVTKINLTCAERNLHHTDICLGFTWRNRNGSIGISGECQFYVTEADSVKSITVSCCLKI